MPLHLLQRRDEDALNARERAREIAIEKLRRALHDQLPGQAVWVYGSILTPGRFRLESDIDIALERSPEGRSIYALQSLLTEATGHAVDICLLEETRIRAKIESHGQRWTEPTTNDEQLTTHEERRSMNEEPTKNEKTWIAAWRRAGPELERIRREELRRLDNATGTRQATWLGVAEPPAPRPTSGLIEFQAWMMKWRRQLQAEKRVES